MKAVVLRDVEEGTIVALQDGTLASVVQQDTIVTLVEVSIQDHTDEIPAAFYLTPGAVVCTL